MSEDIEQPSNAPAGNECEQELLKIFIKELGPMRAQFYSMPDNFQRAILAAVDAVYDHGYDNGWEGARS